MCWICIWKLENSDKGNKEDLNKGQDTWVHGLKDS